VPRPDGGEVEVDLNRELERVGVESDDDDRDEREAKDDD
jgi:hypothetical protein